jgi:general secretion pathway protein L
MTKDMSVLQGRIGAFLTWWGTELVAALPPSLARLFRSNSPLWITHGEDGFRLVDTGGTMPAARGGAVDLEAPAQQALIGGASEVRLCVDKTDYLVKRIRLPIETEENLREVLAFEMDSQTPFAAEQVYYDYLINERDKDNRMLVVTLFLVPRDKLLPALEGLAEAGVGINAISPLHEDATVFGRINLLPAQMRRKPLKAFRVISYALIALILALAAANLVWPIWHKASRLAALEAELAGDRQRASEVLALKQRFERAELENRFLEERKRAAPQLTELLNELTLLLPDDTWINHFELREDQVFLQGESLAAAALIPLIDASRLFKDVTFRSPVTQNPKNDTERFHLSAGLVPQQEAAK